jgi:hypothetical protein
MPSGTRPLVLIWPGSCIACLLHKTCWRVFTEFWAGHPWKELTTSTCSEWSFWENYIWMDLSDFLGPKCENKLPTRLSSSVAYVWETSFFCLLALPTGKEKRVWRFPIELYITIAYNHDASISVLSQSKGLIWSSRSIFTLSNFSTCHWSGVVFTVRCCHWRLVNLSWRQPISGTCFSNCLWQGRC